MEPKLELERPQQVPDLKGKVRMEVETCSLGVSRGAEAWSLSEHSPWIEREGCGLSSLCGAQGVGQRQCGSFGSKDPGPAPSFSRGSNVC